MTTIAEKLTLLNSTKASIKSAIEAKGVTVGTAAFADYPSKISSIITGAPISDYYWNYAASSLTFNDQQVLKGIPFSAVWAATNNTNKYLKTVINPYSSPLPTGLSYASNVLSGTLSNYPGNFSFPLNFEAYSIDENTETYGMLQLYTAYLQGYGNLSTLSPNTGDFCIEMLFNCGNLYTGGYNQSIVSIDNQKISINIYDNNRLDIYINGSTVISETLTTPLVASSTTWYRLALTRESGTLRLFLNGILIKSVSNITQNITFGTSAYWYIGGQTAWGSLNNLGYFRYSIGTARYTAAYTPSLLLPSADSYTKLLFKCNNKSVPAQESAGSGITFTIQNTGSYGKVYTAQADNATISAVSIPLINGTYLETKQFTLSVLGTADSPVLLQSPYLGIASYSSATYAVIPITIPDAYDTLTFPNITSTISGITISRTVKLTQTIVEQVNTSKVLITLSIPALNSATISRNQIIPVNITMRETFAGVSKDSIITVYVTTPNTSSGITEPFIEYDAQNRPITYYYYNCEYWKKTTFSDFVVPTGATSITAHVVGAGGYGCGNDTSNYGPGGGGGAGTYITINSPTIGASYAVDVGRSYGATGDPFSQGIGWTSGVGGYQSQQSSFGGLITAQGGWGGGDNTTKPATYTGGTGANGGVQLYAPQSYHHTNGGDGYAGAGQNGDWWATSNWTQTSSTYRGGNATGKFGGGGGGECARSQQYFQETAGGTAGSDGGKGGHSYAHSSTSATSLCNGHALGKFSIIPTVNPINKFTYNGGAINTGGYGGFFGGGSAGSAYNSGVSDITGLQTNGMSGASGAVIVEVTY